MTLIARGNKAATKENNPQISQITQIEKKKDAS